MEIGPIFSWADNYDLYIATCPSTPYRYDNACVPPNTLNAFGMQYTHVSVDLQLYQMHIAIERPSALDRPHPSPMHDAHSHERTRRGIAKAVRLTPKLLLPCREAILHNTTRKSQLNGILYGYPLQYNIQLVNKLDCIVTHAEADIICVFRILNSPTLLPRHYHEFTRSGRLIIFLRFHQV